MTSLPEIVRTAFAHESSEPPTVERVDRMGYSAQEIQVIEREKARRRKAISGESEAD